jgi:hypothetical protein
MAALPCRRRQYRAEGEGRAAEQVSEVVRELEVNPSCCTAGAGPSVRDEEHFCVNFLQPMRKLTGLLPLTFAQPVRPAEL